MPDREPHEKVIIRSEPPAMQRDVEHQKAQVKFVIHDLRIGKFFEWLIQVHTALGQRFPGHTEFAEDIIESRRRARVVRSEYERAVKNFAPADRIVEAGLAYIRAVDSTIELVLGSRWASYDDVAALVEALDPRPCDRLGYDNAVRWLKAIRRRITIFLLQFEKGEPIERIRLAEVVRFYVEHDLRAYIAEMTAKSVTLDLERADPGVVEGNQARLLRMVFNLVMNAVDAFEGRVGTITLSIEAAGDRLVLRVTDTGKGMPPEKVRALLAERKSLDGELHSLGFVFVRETVAKLQGDLRIDSEVGAGTTITVTLPMAEGAHVAPAVEEAPAEAPTEPPRVRLHRADRADRAAADVADMPFGTIVLGDYERSKDEYVEALFAISFDTSRGCVEYFRHSPGSAELWEHDALDPALSEATFRARYEEFEPHGKCLILKPPKSWRDYFDWKEVPVQSRNPQFGARMEHDEAIGILRALAATGMPRATPVLLDRALERHFRAFHRLPEAEVFSLGELTGLQTLQESEAAAGRLVSNGPPRVPKKDDYGDLILQAYGQAPGQNRGAIFAMALDLFGRVGEVDYFRLRSYALEQEINHDDLDPMFYRATFRGRFTEQHEETENYGAALILKFPHDPEEYCDFHRVPSERRGDVAGLQHDEAILIARILRRTGLSRYTYVLMVPGLERNFGSYGEWPTDKDFTLDELANLRLIGEEGGHESLHRLAPQLSVRIRGLL